MKTRAIILSAILSMFLLVDSPLQAQKNQKLRTKTVEEFCKKRCRRTYEPMLDECSLNSSNYQECKKRVVAQYRTCKENCEVGIKSFSHMNWSWVIRKW